MAAGPSDVSANLGGLKISGSEGGKAPTSGQQDPSQWMFDNEHIIGNGSFGVVYQATVRATQKEVAIKKVLQDKRFKVRRRLLAARGMAVRACVSGSCRSGP